ncbi:MAG TPA: D-aminoacylase [Bryobacteraceae bacterium]|nr:D-aminoacylase [Bryobacteraceae bacterium]
MPRFLVLLLAGLLSAQQYDVIIRHGHIVDGTGSPWYEGDIAIREGHIAAIGFVPPDAKARETIDATGLTIAPGFIDMLGQSELTILVDPRLPSKIYQGITTEITGEGGSAAPLSLRLINADHAVYQHFGITPTWRTLSGYFLRLERQGIGINLASYVGATQVRRMVVGEDDRPATPIEMRRMRELVRDAAEDGAVGLSSALQYPPAPYASTEELIALAREAAHFGGIYATHMRSEGDGIMAALDETIRIGREAKIPVEIWHLKVAGKNNWGRMPEIVAKIEEARRAGVDVAADTYAYTAWANDFSAFIPPWAHDGGSRKMVERLKDPAMRERIRREMMTPSSDWDNEWAGLPGPESIMLSVAKNPTLVPLQGKTVAEIAKMRGTDPIDTIFDLLIEDSAFASVAVFGMSEPDVALALRQPWVSIDNDWQGTSPEGPLGRDHPHPRAYGTFPRILRKYVREERLLSLEEAVRKFTALPAARMRLIDRGVIKHGMWADLVAFNAEQIRDLATFEHPNQLSVGMEYVLVNGVPVIDHGKMTGRRPGKVLRGLGYELGRLHR